MSAATSEILHVDLDAFYVSVSRLGDPDLTGRPVIVGGAGPRGVVLSCSYEARSSGVRNGMPSARARRLCPAAVFVPPDFEAYAAASARFRGVLESFTPVVEPVSLDEAFCDVSGAHRLYGATQRIGERIREAVRGELGLVCSVGAGPSKLVAKVASRACKPDGLLVVDDPVAFLHPLGVDELWGVGAATATALRRLGVTTVGELAATSPALLRSAVGAAAVAHLSEAAWGRDASPVAPRADARSVGAEETFDTDIDAEEVIGAELLRLSDRVASRLVAARLRARTITIKLRVADFETFTRSATLPVPTADVWTIFTAAEASYRRFRRGRRALRLLGVTGSGLVAGAVSEQLSFDPRPAYAEAEEAMERVRTRFGREALRLARLLEERKR